MTAVLEASDLIVRTASAAGPAVTGLGPGWRGGSGVVIADGRVLTAAHNLRRDGARVVFADGSREAAELLGIDRDLDLAVLGVETRGIASLAVGGGSAGDAAADGAGIALGAPVVALARPGGRALRVTHGFVATDAREVRGPRGRRIPAIEHTAPLPRGSSGGPLLDAAGRLVGINVIRLDGGLIVAVDVLALADEIERLARGETPTRRRLGVAVAPPHVARRMRRAVGLPDATGILVRGVEDGSPAASAGIERGDLLTAAAGTPLERIDDLYKALDSATDSLTLTVLRGSDARDVTISFGS